MRFTALLALAALTACGTPDGVTRRAPVDIPPVPEPRPVLAVAKVDVEVPIGLEVSEAPVFYPFADVVWRGDPSGDRLVQVQTLFEEAAAAQPSDGQPANVRIEVVRFHGLTQQARYAIGGIYGIQFRLTLSDPKTGAALAEPRLVRANLNKFGPWHATYNDAKGITEREMVIAHLTEVLRTELGQPSLPDPTETD